MVGRNSVVDVDVGVETLTQQQVHLELLLLVQRNYLLPNPCHASCPYSAHSSVVALQYFNVQNDSEQSASFLWVVCDALACS